MSNNEWKHKRGKLHIFHPAKQIIKGNFLMDFLKKTGKTPRNMWELFFYEKVNSHFITIEYTWDGWKLWLFCNKKSKMTLLLEVPSRKSWSDKTSFFVSNWCTELKARKCLKLKLYLWSYPTFSVVFNFFNHLYSVLDFTKQPL